jgi:hypothetical protein
MGVAHCGANILVAKQLLDFPQILSHVVEQDRRRRVAQAVGGNQFVFAGYSGAPFSNRAFNLRLRAACRALGVGERRREGDSAGSQDPAPFKILLDGLPLE